MPVRRNPIADALFFGRYNENHDPDNGQFSSGGGSGGSSSSTSGSSNVKSGQAKASGSGKGSGGGGKAGSGSLEQAQAAAATAANGRAKLSGLPDKPIKLGNEYYVPGPIAKVHETAANYMKSAGLTYNPPDTYIKVDPERASRIANAFSEMKHDPDDPKVKASYEALAKETIAQWKAVKESGLKVEWIKEGQADPYADSPRRAAMDVSLNNHWWGFPTDFGFGNDSEEAKEAAKTNPMLAMTDEVVDGRKCCVNDLFRVVHDYFGHFKDGVGFRADGEDNAWRSHVAMFSDAAKGAMTTETRGQNSWVNFGPYGESNKAAKAADTHFAPQKVGLLPEWVWKGENSDKTNGGSRAAVFVSGRARAFDPVIAYTRSLFERYNENHDPDNGQFTSGSGGGGSGSTSSSSSGSSAKPASSSSSSKGKTSTGTTAKPASAAVTSTESKSESSEKKKASVSDFVKDKVQLGRFTADKAKIDKFIDDWDSKVGGTPADFKANFLGGVDASMTIDVESDGTWAIQGSIIENGREVGTYTRRIDWRTKTAASDYFALNRSATGHDVGKRVLAGNVEMYQKMGLEKVKVHANIDVGGYAWAKYGYVPDRSSWQSLQGDILERLGDGGSSHGSGSGYTPESWEEISDSDQSDIEDAWKRSTRDEFIESEITNWRDSGSALDDAKTQVSSEFNDRGTVGWAHDAINDWLEDRENDGKPVPYNAAQLVDAMTLDYANGYEGRGDLDISFDDDNLKNPSNAPSPDQGTLPGIEEEDLSQRLTEEMRDELTKVISDAFDSHSQTVSENLDPPEYIYDSIDDYQSDYWESMDDRSRFAWARDNGSLPSYDDPDAEEQTEMDIDDDASAGLEKLARSSDPKALWAIADSPQGKDLLLGSDWYGTLNLKDADTMERFNAYVGKKAKT
jgi:hypothetical protein